MGFVKSLLCDIIGRRRDNFDWRLFQPGIDLTTVDRICILLLNEKLGDAILISPLIDALTDANPDLSITIGTRAGLEPYWRSHPMVAETVVLRKGIRGMLLLRTFKCFKEGKRYRDQFDVAIYFQPYVKADHLALLRGMRAKNLIGFNKQIYRLFDYSLDERRHGADNIPIVKRTESIMNVFGKRVEPDTFRFHVRFGVDDVALARRTLSPYPGRKMLLNTYGAGREKHLTPESAARSVREIRNAGFEGYIFVSVPESKEQPYQSMLRDERTVVVGPQEKFSELFAFVDQMDIVVSPDTAIGHVAAALGKPQVCLFAHRGNVPQVWKPLNDRCQIVVSKQGKDVNDMNWAEVGDALRLILDDAFQTA